MVRGKLFSFFPLLFVSLLLVFLQELPEGESWTLENRQEIHAGDGIKHPKGK